MGGPGEAEDEGASSGRHGRGAGEHARPGGAQAGPDLSAYLGARPEELGGLPHDDDRREASNLACVMCLAGLAEALLVACPEQRERWIDHVADAQTRVLLHYDPVRRIFRESAHAAALQRVTPRNVP